jgi:hypothetical protein
VSKGDRSQKDRQMSQMKYNLRIEAKRSEKVTCEHCQSRKKSGFSSIFIMLIIIKTTMSKKMLNALHNYITDEKPTEDELREKVAELAYLMTLQTELLREI